MQIGCKPDANALDLNGIPNALFRAWAHVPKHIRLAILALIEPYREHRGAEKACEAIVLGDHAVT